MNQGRYLISREKRIRVALHEAGSLTLVIQRKHMITLVILD